MIFENLFKKKQNDITYIEFCDIIYRKLSNSISFNEFYDIELLLKCIDLALTNKTISTIIIQRKFSIGYARASILKDILEDSYIVEVSYGSREGNILISTFSEAIECIYKYFIEKDLQSKENNNSQNTLDLSNINNGIDFEKFCSSLLNENNFTDICLTKQSNDYGVDIIAFKDDIKYAFQCKFYSQPVGVSSVQEICAGKNYYNCHIAVVITNTTFTKNAIELAKRNNVLLWDYSKINSLSGK